MCVCECECVCVCTLCVCACVCVCVGGCVWVCCMEVPIVNNSILAKVFINNLLFDYHIVYYNWNLLLGFQCQLMVVSLCST